MEIQIHVILNITVASFIHFKRPILVLLLDVFYLSYNVCERCLGSAVDVFREAFKMRTFYFVREGPGQKLSTEPATSGPAVNRHACFGKNGKAVSALFPN